MISLHGKTALVTGASRGLGAAIATRLAEAGARLALHHYPDEAQAVNARDLARQLGNGATVHAADVRDAEVVNALLADVGPLDIVVNNAGIVRDRTVAKMSDAEWNDVLATNLSGPFHVCRAAIPHLRDGGRIVNIASVSGAVGLFGQGNYAATKAGVVGLTRTLSRELARRGITVNAIAPGLVLTEMGLSVPEPVREQWLREIPLGRFAEPEEIANAVLFLSSSLASYVSGQTLHVNGGWYA